MPLTAERELRQNIRDQAFARAYYFFGENDFLKESTARELISAAVESGLRVFNSDVLRGGEVSAEALDLAVNTPPMFASRRVVLLRDAHELSKDARRALDRYLDSPATTTVLILLVPAGEDVDGTIVARASAVEFPMLDARRVARWMVHYATTSLGVEVTPEAAELLYEGVGDDLAALAAELDKAASYAPGQPITPATVADVVGVRRGESLGDLLEAVVQRDAGRAVSLLPAVLEQPKQTAVSLVMTLTTQLLAIGWGEARQSSTHVGGRALERDFIGLLRETRAYTGRSWGEATGSWSRAVSRWTSREIDDGIALLLATDYALKESRVSSDDQLLMALVLGLCRSSEPVAA